MSATWKVCIAILLFLGSWAWWPLHSLAEPGDDPAVQTVLSPETTVILANAADARFSRDFSVWLKYLRIPWITVESATVPAEVRDNDVILLGQLNGPYTGELLRRLMTAAELEAVRANAEGTHVLEKPSPWAEGRSVILCIGADLVHTRNAAETAVKAIIARAPPTDNWLKNRYTMPLDDNVEDDVAYLRFTWEEAELPLADLTLDVKANPRRVSNEQAAADVERLFYLFSHGYAGYAFFNRKGEFAEAKTRILAELPSRAMWSSQALSRLLYKHLSFITDCHLKIGDYRYAEHQDFWYDTAYPLTVGRHGYQFMTDAQYTVHSINGEAPEAFIVPSLNAQGDPVYRLGMLAKNKPAPLKLVASRGEEVRTFEIKLERSDFTYYAEAVFREESIGGIPVIRVRSFSDRHADALQAFVETAKAHKEDAVIVVDLRGNSGGNEAWPIRWIQGLTGRRADSVFIFSELQSKTTMTGRANVFAYMAHHYPRAQSYPEEEVNFTQIAQMYESRTYTPSWKGPLYPQLSLIPNDTTLIIVINGHVASAGEGFVMRASRAENVILVGENTQGCITFGNAGMHQLPHSKLLLHMPINFGFFRDMKFREEKGLMPDLWVPAADAVNYAIAAARSGTLSTHQALPAAILAQDFAPENPNARVRMMAVVITFIAAVWAYFMRHKPKVIMTIASIWICLGGVWLQKAHIFGLGFLFAGITCLVFGSVRLFLAKKSILSRSQ